jgi:hypothetical protein
MLSDDSLLAAVSGDVAKQKSVEYMVIYALKKY